MSAQLVKPTGMASRSPDLSVTSPWRGYVQLQCCFCIHVCMCTRKHYSEKRYAGGSDVLTCMVGTCLHVAGQYSYFGVTLDPWLTYFRYISDATLLLCVLEHLDGRCREDGRSNVSVTVQMWKPAYSDLQKLLRACFSLFFSTDFFWVCWCISTSSLLICPYILPLIYQNSTYQVFMYMSKAD